MPTSVALGAHFETFIKEQVASGRYNNASEVVREGLRMLETQKEDRRLQREALKAEIEKGLEGPSYPAEQVFAEVYTMIEEMEKIRQEN